MKKVLFAVYGLGIGGVEKCLVNLVNNMDKSNYDITIAVMNPEYDYRVFINRDVKIIDFENNFLNTTDSMSYIMKMPFSFRKGLIFFKYCLYRIFVKVRWKPWLFQLSPKEQYDYAVAYTHVGHVPEYVIDRVSAKKKILWYHTTWTDRKEKEYYSKFDEVVTVSNYCKNEFCKTFPELKKKVLLCHNLYNFDEIIEDAKKGPTYSTNKFLIVTVGRLSEEKGCYLAVDSCKELMNQVGEAFDWIWVGDGPLKNEIRKYIVEQKVENVFHLVGSTTNPYGYMAQADIYVHTAKREAFCTAIMEAKCLNIPVISTNFQSVFEQIEDGVDGYIVEMDANDIAETVEKIMKANLVFKDVWSNCTDNWNRVSLKEVDEAFSLEG